MGKIVESGKNHLFANMMNLSSFVHEEEVLFMSNTRFRIQSVTNWNGIFWILHLTLLSLDDKNENNKPISQLFNKFGYRAV